jgi:hypothetical protein
MPFRLRIFLFWLFAGTLGAAPSSSNAIAEAEALQLPTAQRIATVLAAAQREGWEPQAAPLRAAAQIAYGRNQLAIADAWFNLYRWVAIFGVRDSDYLPQWTHSVKTLGVAHAGMPQTLPVRRQPLGFLLLPEVQVWLLGSTALSQEFFSLLTPVDYVPGVFRILNELHFNDPVRCKTYGSLALAIALVYDVPPPPHWPHGQVPSSALARRLPRPVDAFNWWTKQDEQGKTYHRLNRLGADELKFVVDATAPFIELEWSQQVVSTPLNSLARAYTLVRYDIDRVQRNELIWRGPTYALDDVLAAGGICVDQGYFATQVGKARGVPTLLFRGQGVDSRHAWFGFLDAKEKWQLDVGRYAEQRFVTGYVLDPQTWIHITDHQLKFLAERFRTRPTFQQSRIHAEFAANFLGSKDPATALQAARKAVSAERRNHVAWEIVFAAEHALGRDPKDREATLREAAAACEDYPDLEALYTSRMTESMRARGDAEGAEREQNRIAKKNHRNREDLGVQAARRTLVRAFATQTVEEQVQTYNSLVAAMGSGAGIAFFDQIVRPFVEQMMRLQRPVEAANAIETARQVLKFGGNSQMAREFNALQKRLTDGS